MLNNMLSFLALDPIVLNRLGQDGSGSFAEEHP